MKALKRRSLSLLLVLTMLFTLLPVGAMAAEGPPADPPAAEETQPPAPEEDPAPDTEEETADPAAPEETPEPELWEAHTVMPAGEDSAGLMASSDLIISEYVEGSSSNKAVEIYNGTGASVTLDGVYSLCMWNFSDDIAVTTPIGPEKENKMPLTGTLANGEVLVIYNSKANGTIKSVKGAIVGTGNICNFNGNDPIALKKNDVVIDAIGPYTNEYAIQFGKDKTFVRNAEITAPNATYTPSEWTEYPKDTFDYLGYHGEPVEVTQAATPKADPAAGAVVAGTLVELTCETAGAEIYYTNDGTAPSKTNGTKYTAPITITSATTIKAIAVDPTGKLTDSAVLEAAYTIMDKMDISAARALGKGKAAIVEGTVIAKYVNSSMSSLGCYIQDATGGIMLYDKDHLGDYEVGDQLRASGTTAEYNGKFELTDVTVTKLSSAGTVTPQLMTADEFATPAIAEAKEGMLVTISGLAVTSVETDSYKTCTLTLDSGGKTVTAKLDNRRPNFMAGKLEGKTGPGDTVDVVGYIESNGDNKKHLLHLRSADDVTVTAESSVVAAPTAEKPSGSQVNKGEKIPITCATPGAVIQYNTTSATAADQDWQAVPAGGLVMPDIRGNYTIYVRAVKEGKTASQVITLSYAVGLAAMTSIYEARQQAVGEEVYIQGVVVGNDGYDLFIQDDTAGVAIETKMSDWAGLKVGDEVSVRATVQGPDSYSKLLEFKPIDNGITIVNGSAPAPQPIPVTTAMINTGLYEGCLVKLSQVTLVSKGNAGKVANHSIASKGGVECDLRFWLGDTPAENAILDIVGVASTFLGKGQLIQQTKAENIGVTASALDGSTVGDPIEEAVVWSAPSNGTEPPANQIWPAVSGPNMKDAGLTTGGGAKLGATTGQGYSANSWDSGVGKKYWQVKFSTTGMSDITISSYQRSSGTGPSAFQVQYSLDGNSFQNVAGGNMQLVYDKGNKDGRYTLQNLPLPTDANNKPTVYVRWVLASNQQVSDASKEVASGGANQINSIVVSGREYYGPNDVAPVKSEPAAGAVPLNTVVTLRCATAGTTIRYTTDGTDPSATVGTAGASVTLDTLPATVKAVAYQTGDPAKICPVKTFAFTQAQVDQPNCNKADGAKIIVGLDTITFTAKKDATVKYTLNGGAEKVYDPAKPITLAETDFAGGNAVIRVWAGMANYLDSAPVTLTFTMSQGGEPKNYFGQLHSHTAENSDGAGTLEEAFSYAASKSGVDFMAVTDHSNGFDKSPSGDGPETYNLTTYGADNPQWIKGHEMAERYTSDSFVGIYGYEMTWSGGPGHINTYNTTGFVSRNNSILNSKNKDAGMRAYYELLSRPESAASLSQFNHPGTTFGNFTNYAYYTPTLDSRITLIEVGNGEGAIGSGGYFPSYSEYTLALDKGWHLAPTNNQDNHHGLWGNANNARSVAYTNDLTEEGIYQAMRDMRVYATEDKNLDIVYKVNGAVMGSILAQVPASAAFNVTINDPDSTDQISTVEIITVGGKVAHKVENINQQSYTLDYTMEAPAAGYYYIRVTEADRDIAVTAPIWLGAAAAIGMSELTTDTFMTVKGEPVNLDVNFFNNETEGAILKSVKYTIKGTDTVLSDEPNLNQAIEPMGSLDKTLAHAFGTVGKQTVVITAVMSVAGTEKTLTSELELDVKDPDALLYVGIDGSHHNEYVSGNYKDSMDNFGTLAAEYDVRVNVLNTSEELLAALSNPKYKMFVFTVPTRRLVLDQYDVYSKAELDAVAAFAKGGGTVVAAGWGDYYENYANSPKEPEMQMAYQQNQLLAAIGSKLRVSDDEAKDNDNKPGSNAARLYLTDYNGFQNPLLAGVNPQQVWSQYGGSTIYAVDETGKPAAALPESVIPIISGFGKYESDGSGIDLDKIDSYDEDGDGYIYGEEKTVQPPKYPSDHGNTVLLTASETVDQGNGKTSLVVVSGGAFMSNFEIKFDLDNASQLNYSNYMVLSNLVETLNPPTITPIADVQKAGDSGVEYTIEGTVMTSVWNGSDTNTGFFDCIYIQDDTGGINVFPVSSGVEPGQKVRITGTSSAYEGERQLAVESVKVLTYTPGALPAAKKVTTKDVADQTYLGQLIQVTGKVVAGSIMKTGSAVGSFQLMDESGTACKIFIDGYITKGKTISGLADGKTFTAIGISSFSGDNPRVRVFDRANVYDPTYVPPSGGDDSGGDSGGSGSGPNKPATPAPAEPKPDVEPVEVKKDAQVKGDGSASATVSDKELNAAVTEAGKTGASEIVIEVGLPEGTKEAPSVTAALPQNALAAAAKEGLALTVDTPNGSITLPGAAMSQLGKLSNVSVTAAKAENGGVAVTVAASGEPLETVSGGIIATLPAAAPAQGMVPVLLRSDGTEEVIIKSTVGEEGVSALLAGSGTVLLRDNSKDFADTQGHWAAGAMDFTSARGLFQGVSETEFAPDGLTSRGMVVTVLFRMEGTPAALGQTLADVRPGDYFAAASAWALEQEITTGDENGHFQGSRNITVGELTTMVYRYAQAMGLDTSGRADLTAFHDGGSVPEWAREATAWAVEAGIIQGNDQGLIQAGSSATRAQLAVISQRIVALFF